MKKLSIMIFMAASMMVACDNNTKTQPEAGEEGYISTNGEGVDTEEMIIDRTANQPAVEEEQPLSEGVEEAEARSRKAMTEEQKRLKYWTLEEEKITPEAEALNSNLEQLDKNWFRIEADLKNVETGTYNPAGQMTREAQTEIKQARAKVAEAKRMVQSAQQRNEAGKLEGAAEKLKAANEKLASAREDYMEALEKETGVTMEDEITVDMEQQ